jgi:hypothetical protein
MLLRWLNPTTWPWMVWVWLAFLLLGWTVSAWRWFQRSRAAGWPIADGRVESVDVRKPSFSLTTRRGYYIAELRYWYSVAGAHYSGRYRRDCPSEGEGNEFVRDLQGKPVPIHYDAGNPARSSLLDSDLESVLQDRAPASDSSSAADSIPEWLRPLLWTFTAISAVGLVVSVWVHIGAIMGHSVPAIFWILHMGIFVVWFPAVLVAQKLGKNAGRNDAWKVVMRGSPTWMRYMTYFFFAYAFVNFFLFMQQDPTQGALGATPASQWRGFSGHWMLFYSAALSILYSAARLADTSPRCVNGHLASPSATYCPQCGQPVILPRQQTLGLESEGTE